MAGKDGVIGFNVELEVVEQVVLSKEIQAGGCVGIVLVFGRFLGLGLDVELSLKANFLFVIDCHVQEATQVVQFPL